MTSIGLVLTSFGAAMRDPVTVISWISAVSAVASAACWDSAGRPAKAIAPPKTKHRNLRRGML
jgi:hypothetical protein